MATQTIGETTFRASRNYSPSGADADVMYLNPDEVRDLKGHVYVHNVCALSFTQPQALRGMVHIPACPAGSRFVTAIEIPHPYQYLWSNPDKGGAEELKAENGINVALSICNPDFVGADLSVQEKEPPMYTRTSSGCNLASLGVFASFNKIPTQEETDAARKRMERTLKRLFEEANSLERSSPALLAEILRSEHHLAADYFGVDVSWHRVVSHKIECPNCGEKIKEGVSHHYTNGHICVLDWQGAWLKGAVKKEEVPEPMQWWNEERRGPGRPPKA